MVAIKPVNSGPNDNLIGFNEPLQVNYSSSTVQFRCPAMWWTVCRLFFTAMSYALADCFGSGSINSGQRLRNQRNPRRVASLARERACLSCSFVYNWCVLALRPNCIKHREIFVICWLVQRNQHSNHELIKKMS
jgi:hypothetical protein